MEERLSEEPGRTVWTESGLGAPADLDQLQRRITNWNNNSPMCKDSWTNEPRNWTLHAPPTVN
ncbi:hypothetical protein AB5J49_00620 [Streptomyces sp. R28]|uniref:Uncharacterized protein n=1 Tax=Streptomyces sp. R28 TaxID=3238628 RepID=A0AB39PMN1_9ACTN